MPELPEVETTKNKISLYLKNQCIERMVVRQTQLRWPVSAEIIQLRHQKVSELLRRGKYIILKLHKGYILIHLGMTGFFKISHNIDTPVTKHDHIDIILDNGILLRYNDVRRFGSWQWIENLEDNILIQRLGVEPLSDDFNSEYLIKCLRNKHVASKIAIMDGQIVVGIGNIYASEALFLAGIHPETLASELTSRQIHLLINAIKKVLYKALDEGGTTIKNFQQPDGQLGYFVQQLNVYGRKGEHCVQCHGFIESKQIGQRNSFFCPYCQKKRQVDR